MSTSPVSQSNKALPKVVRKPAPKKTNTKKGIESKADSSPDSSNETVQNEAQTYAAHQSQLVSSDPIRDDEGYIKYNNTIKDGKHKIKYPFSGDLYKGGWKDGEKHGTGKLTNADGAVYDGEW